MGSRANLLIVTDESYELFYTHHRAQTLDRDLFWGPDYALGFIRAQRPVDDSGWLDEVWAEGGAVLDVSRRVLLWFGGEFVMHDVQLRRAHARMMGVLWREWQIRWASGGVAEMAAYVGRPAATVLTGDIGDPVHIGRHVHRDTPASTVVLLVNDPEFHLYNFLLPATRMAVGGGPALVDRLAELNAAGHQWDGRFDTAPFGGLTIDPDRRTLGVWVAGDFPDAFRRLRQAWPGWTIAWDEDRFETQLNQSGGRLQFPQRRRESLENELRDVLLKIDDGPSGAETILSVANAMTNQTGQPVTGINPAALYDARLSISLDVRTWLFDAAVAAMA